MILKTFQKERGGDPIFLKIENKSLAEAKLRNGKKTHFCSYRITIQIEWINLLGQRKPQSWEKIVTSGRYVLFLFRVWSHTLVKGDGQAVEWGGLGNLVADSEGVPWWFSVEKQAPGSACWDSNLAPPLARCQDLQTRLFFLGLYFLHYEVRITGAPASLGVCKH